MSSDRPIIEIWSHARAPPLRPGPDLAFDCRKINNPPKDIRDKYDGRSKRLKEHLLHDSAFIDLLDAAVAEVTEAYERYLQNAAALPTATPRADKAGQETHEVQAASDRSGGYSESDGVGDPKSQSQDSSEESQDQSSDDAEAAESAGEDPVLRISCSCVRGRHRSVAFAEELVQRLPASWNIQIRHRDVTKKNSSDRKHRDAKGRGRGLSHMLTDQDGILD